jgi:predicted aldo/keto reductase-like oxidoreductase
MKILDISASDIPLRHTVPQLPIKFPESNLAFYRQLGRTDLTVSCLGLGGGAGISSEDTLYAFDQGINYFFFSSDLHHYLYRSMADGLRQLCGRGAAKREQVVLATVTYIKSPEMAIAALLDQFSELGIDYIDVLFWGWIGEQDGPVLDRCLQLTPDLRGPNTTYSRMLERMFGVSERLKKMGAVRYIGASFHSLALAQQWLSSPLLDVVMVRHNMAHRSAQSQIFNQLTPNMPDRSGIVTFKSTGSHSGSLWLPPEGLPQGCWVPEVPDLYRYSLSQNCVDVCLTGLSNRQEIDAAVAAIERGRLTNAEITYLNAYGDLHRQVVKPSEISSEVWLYRD